MVVVDDLRRKRKKVLGCEVIDMSAKNLGGRVCKEEKKKLARRSVYVAKFDGCRWCSTNEG